MKRWLQSLLALLTLSGCSGLDVVDALSSRDGYVVRRDIAYGPHSRQRLDIYTPTRPRPDAAPIIFVHGGSWENGDKADYRFVGSAFANAGHVVIIPNYRLHPEVVWPAFVEDTAAAVAFVVRGDGGLGATPRRPVLIGHSAGAYNAMSVVVDRRWLTPWGIDPSVALAGVVGLSGPYDFLPLTSPTLMTIFGPEAARPDTQPINHVDGRNPPTLLIHGTADTTVLPRNTINLAARIKERGGAVEVVMYDGADHGLTVGALVPLLRWRLPVWEAVSDFLARSPP